jgi:EmrB/QacA subfamily drug resistance transporter
MSVREAPLRSAPTTPTTPTNRRLTPLLFVGLMLGLLLAELDQTMFSTALPTIAGELGGVDRMLWVTTAYVLTGTVVMPVYGKLGDLLGRKPLFVAALSVFVAGCVLGGLAPDMTWLIVARAVQGLGGGGLLILIQAIIADVVPARERAAAMVVVGAVFALSAMLGPVLGGWLTDGLGWRWAFWINLPLGAAAIASGAAFLPSAPRRVRPVSIDVAGIVAMTVAVTAIVLVASWGGVTYRWGSPVIVSISVIAVLASAVFIAAERQAAEPIIPLALFRNRTFTAATVAGLVMAVAMFGAIAYLPTYLQMVNGLGATGAGLVMLTLVAGLAVTSVGSAQIVRRTGQYVWLPVVGCALVAVALALLSTLTVGTELRVIGSYLFLLGAGIGCALEILVLVVQNACPASQVGTATAAFSFFREIGVALGSAVVGTMFTSRLFTFLADRVPGRTAAQLDPYALTPAQVVQYPDALKVPIVSSYNDALTPVFWCLMPLVLVSMAGLWLIRSVPLTTTEPGSP